MRGDFPILDAEFSGVMIPHIQGARLLRKQSRNIRRTDSRGVITAPIAVIISALRNVNGDKHLVKKLNEVHQQRLDAGSQTSIQIGPGKVAADIDLGIKRSGTVGPEQVQDLSDDQVLIRLLSEYGVSRLTRTYPGVDARWQLPGRSPSPYVEYVGLPSDLPPFNLRPCWEGGYSLVEIYFGKGVIYSRVGRYPMIHFDKPLPGTLAGSLEGRRVDEVVSHPALRDLVFGPFDEKPGTGGHLLLNSKIQD